MKCCDCRFLSEKQIDILVEKNLIVLFGIN